jgi:hypothetical protein
MGVKYNMDAIKEKFYKKANAAVQGVAMNYLQLIYDMSPVFTGAYKASHRVTLDNEPEDSPYRASAEEKKSARHVGNTRKGAGGTPIGRFSILVDSSMTANQATIMQFDMRHNKQINFINQVGAAPDADEGGYAHIVEYLGWARTKEYAVYETARMELTRGGLTIVVNVDV